MGDEVLNQAAAWNLYDGWLENGGALYAEEPPQIEDAFRSFTQSRNAAAKDWADSYLAAFATAAGLRFVTFDRAYEGKIKQLLVLKP
jgi:uncharacterized protein